MEGNRRGYTDESYEVRHEARRRRREQERRLRALQRRRILIGGMAIGGILLLIVVCVIINAVKTSFFNSNEVEEEVEVISEVMEIEEVIEIKYVDEPEIDEQLISINEYSRPGIELESVDNIVIHYTGNPGTTGQQNRDYYQELSVTGETSVSSNFVIGLEGEIILCVPTDEVAYASNHANSTSLSVEVCHWDETGAFTEESYDSVVHLAAWLCQEYGLEATDVIRHYDVTGKECPIYYVENPDEWDAFIEDVDAMLNGYQ